LARVSTKVDFPIRPGSSSCALGNGTIDEMQVTFLDFGKSRNHAGGLPAEGGEWPKNGNAKMRRNYVL
jgi:hypothetical protein